MASNSNEPNLDLSIFAKPNLRTSRRNFVAAASVLAAAVVGLGLRSTSAKADASPTGCSSSDDEPKSCSNCFLSGTKIATPNGEVEIEKLRVGDLVISVSGGTRPVKWIGRRHLTRQPSEAWHPEAIPVKVARFALDDRTPHTDLYLSRAHAIYLGGLLIPVANLVNGRTITHHNTVALALEYYHIELAKHDVVLAEGLPAETFAGDSRSGFDNAQEYERVYGASAVAPRSFAPLVSLNGGRQELMSRLRSIVSPIYDLRRPIDLIRDEIASRADLGMAA
jgi:hypothetical protein